MEEHPETDREPQGGLSVEEYFGARRFRVLILGAGFSVPAGMPLGTNLWKEVRRRAAKLRGRAERFRDDLREYCAFQKQCYGKNITPASLDFEDFLAFLDIEYHLGLRGSDTWSEDGNEGQVVVKTLIGQILAERMPAARDLPQIYYRFAEALQPGDYVLTFNYDVLLERALQHVGKPFRLFPLRYRELRPDGGATVESDEREVAVLKLHGSIDWFDRRSYDREVQANVDYAASIERPAHIPRHPVFSHGENLGVAPILDGLRHSDDPLTGMHRVEHVEYLPWTEMMFRATPWLLSPSRAKVLWAKRLGDFWRGLGRAGGWNLGFGIVGFSLPDHDDYVRQVIFRMIKNYEEGETEISQLKRNPVVLVDRRPSPNEKRAFKKRYSFVDWKRADAYFGGFDGRALALLFARR